MNIQIACSTVTFLQAEHRARLHWERSRAQLAQTIFDICLIKLAETSLFSVHHNKNMINYHKKQKIVKHCRMLTRLRKKNTMAVMTAYNYLWYKKYSAEKKGLGEKILRVVRCLVLQILRRMVLRQFYSIEILRCFTIWLFISGLQRSNLSWASLRVSNGAMRGNHCCDFVLPVCMPFRHVVCIVLIFQIIGFIWGYVAERFLYTVIWAGIGLSVSFIVSVRCFPSQCWLTLSCVYLIGRSTTAIRCHGNQQKSLLLIRRTIAQMMTLNRRAKVRRKANESRKASSMIKKLSRECVVGCCVVIMNECSRNFFLFGFNSKVVPNRTKKNFLHKSQQQYHSTHALQCLHARSSAFVFLLVHSVLFLQFFQFSSLLVSVHFLLILIRVVIKHNQVSALNIRMANKCTLLPAIDVKAFQMINGVFCVINILVHNERSSSGCRCVASVNQTYKEQTKLSTYSRIWRIGPNLPKISYISSAVTLNGRFLKSKWK